MRHIARSARGLASFGRGLGAETAAAIALERDGMTILARRRRTPFGEIDLIAADAMLLCFVEVKQRPTLADAAIALSDRQAQRLWQAADYIVQTEPTWNRALMRFDLIVVDTSGALRRIKDILRADQV